MKRRGHNKSNRTERKKQARVVRCNILNRPMFEYEICHSFDSRMNSGDARNCKSCKHSF